MEKYYKDLLKFKNNRVETHFINQNLNKVKFYKKLDEFGYVLFIKPVKNYFQANGKVIKKANCDVDMAFQMMKQKPYFKRVIFLSGDGDFLPVLKYLKEQDKEIIVLSRSIRTAREVKQFAGSNFRDFMKLKKELEIK